MSDKDQHSSDAELLARIDAILDNPAPSAAAEHADTLAKTITRLQAATPAPEPDFVQRLEQKLVDRHGSQCSARRIVPRWLGWSATITTVVALILLVSLQARSATATALEMVERAALSITAGQEGLRSLQPSPPFTARQLGEIPPGFVLAGNRYAPGAASGGIEAEAGLLAAPDGTPDPILEEALRRKHDAVPRLVLVYHSGDGEIIILYQRQVTLGEALPEGEPREIDGQPARLSSVSERRILTWIAGDTWTELESTLEETALLALARDLQPIPTGASAAPPLAERLRQRIMCDGTQPQLHEPLLGQADGSHLGGFWLTIDERQGHEQIQLSSMGFNVPEAEQGAVFDAAIAALGDPATSLIQLPYPSVGQLVADTDEGCYRRPEVPGYLVIEVWENEVRVGYGGVGTAWREAAIAALEQRR
jgi:hypothetical protein